MKNIFTSVYTCEFYIYICKMNECIPLGNLNSKIITTVNSHLLKNKFCIICKIITYLLLLSI